jgi:hypothetical protein
MGAGAGAQPAHHSSKHQQLEAVAYDGGRSNQNQVHGTVASCCQQPWWARLLLHPAGQLQAAQPCCGQLYQALQAEQRRRSYPSTPC